MMLEEITLSFISLSLALCCHYIERGSSTCFPEEPYRPVDHPLLRRLDDAELRLPGLYADAEHQEGGRAEAELIHLQGG